eukprot:485034-Pyramimonas_sp.AAC.1
MQETWVQGWSGWGRAWDALAGAPDAEDKCLIVEDHAVRFMEFLTGALVLEAETDEERAANMARGGLVV